MYPSKKPWRAKVSNRSNMMVTASVTFIRRTFLFCTATAALTACQMAAMNSGFVAAGIDEVEAHRVRQLFGAHCVLKSVKGASTIAHPAQATEVSVFAITPRSDGPKPGWRAADIAYRGYRDQIFFNPKTAAYLCGTELWREHLRGTRQIPLPTTPIFQAASTQPPEPNKKIGD